MQNNSNAGTLNRQRSNGKGKFLTRSHAMRESTSPPRTPTPRSGNVAPTLTINDQPQQQSSMSNKHENSNRNPSPITINSPQQQQQQPQQQQSSPSSTSPASTNLFATNGNISATQLDLEFPKLTPPKSKSPRNNNNNNNSISISGNNNNNSSTINSSIASTIATNRTSEMDKSPPPPPPSSSSATASNSTICNGPASPSSSVTSSHSPSGEKDEKKGSGRWQNNSNNRSPSSTSTISNVVQSSASPPSSNSQLSPAGIGRTSSPSTELAASLEVPRKTTSPGANAMCTIKVSVTTDQQRSAADQQNVTESNDKSNEDSNDSINQKKRYYNANGKCVIKTPRGRLSGGSADSSDNHSSVDQAASQDAGGGEHLTDQNGVDLLQFFKITLNKNTKDRAMLIRIEKELSAFAQDESRDQIRFPTMSSYNRMLIHRVAAWFGMEHNVDGALQCVIVGATKTTRIPDIRFKSLLTDTFTDEPPSRKSILKRDAHSFDEYRQGLLGCPDRSMLDRKAKSFEEREQEYERAKRRIFKDAEHDSMDQFWYGWSNSGAPEQYKPNVGGGQKGQNNRLLKVQSSSNESRYDGRPGQAGKSHSFGGYGPQSGRLTRGDSVNSTKSAGAYAKQESTHGQQTWRISPSSSGYKTQSQSIRSESITPSPSYGSASGEHTPEPGPPVAASGFVWAVTDMAHVPKGSVLIDPQTMQPIVNQDGSIYHFDPTNLPHCNKLQITAASPTTSTTPTAASPTFSANEGASGFGGMAERQPDAYARGKYKSKPNIVKDSDSGDNVDVPNINCDNDGSHSDVVRNNSNPEIEISPLPCTDSDNTGDATNPISMNALLAPINQIHADTYSNSGADNDTDDASSERCPSSSSYLNADATPTIVRNQSTSPNMPDVNVVDITPNDLPKECIESESRSPVLEVTNISHGIESSPPTLPIKNIKLATESPPISTEYAKKDEHKMMPAVVPVLSYAAAPGPNVYSTMDPGIQMYSNVQPSPATYSTTTYQQGLDGSVYAVPQQMIYGYPAPMEGEYPSIFLPMYDQSMPPTNAQGALMQAAPAAPQPQSSGAMYPQGATMAVLPYGASPNIYPGQVIYTDQYNPTNQAATPPQQYINVPIGYTAYPYNGSPAYPYWGQTAMTYYVPQPMPGGTNSVLPSPSANGPTSNSQLIGPPLLHTTATHINTPNNKSLNNSSHVDTSNSIENSNHIVSQSKASHGNHSNPYTPSPSAENPKLTTYPNQSQPNVFQYPSAATGASASTTSTVSRSGSQTPNQPTPLPSHAHAPPPQPPNRRETERIVENVDESPRISSNRRESDRMLPHHAPPPPSSSTSSTHHSNTTTTHPKNNNNPPLFPTPNNLLTNGIVPHVNHDYHDSGNNNSYERRKNQQNANRKTYSNGSYRPIPGANTNHTYNNPSIPSSGGPPPPPSSASGPRKPALMPQPTEQAQQPSSFNRINTNSAHIDHTDKRPLPLNTNRNNSHGNGPGLHVTHTKGAPLISTLPINAHTGNTYEPRPRGPRPKPLDLRRSTNSSSRNTPSTNSTESNNNNSPSSIVSNSVSHAHHQTPVYFSRGAHSSMHHHHSAANNLESAACSPLAYNPHSGMYVKLGGQAYITHSMAFPNKPHQADMRQQQLQQLTGIYPTMNMMLTGFPPTTRPLGPRPSHINPNYKGNRPR